MRSLGNTAPCASTNSHRYSCWNHISPSSSRSSSRNSFEIHGHSVPFAVIPCHLSSPPLDFSQKNPCCPFAVLSTHRPPSPTASIGRSVLYISSLTRDASSISSSDTAEKPRTLSALSGSPTIRDPFGYAIEMSLTPS